MIDALSYDILKGKLNDKYEEPNRIIGLLFIKPQDTNSYEQIIKELKYYNARSEKYIDFYLPGYGAYWPSTLYNDSKEIVTLDGTKWLYSDQAFNNFRKELEGLCKWKYNGESELLLLNYHHNRIDFSDVIHVWLQKAVRKGYVDSIRVLMERIFRECQSASEIKELRGKFRQIAGTNILQNILSTKIPITKELFKYKFLVIKNYER